MSATLFQLALAVTRSIYKDQLYDWMMAITKATGSIPFITGVGPFDTVARATSGDRMLDATLDGLQQTPNGTEVWVETCGGCTWTWRTDFPAATATDNITTCRPTAWIAGGLDGAFVRNLEGQKTTRTQTAWFVNSTATDDEGAGTALDPLKTDLEIRRRWGEGTIPLSVSVAVTYAQAPAQATNFDVQLLDNGSLTLIGTMTVNKTGLVVTAVTTQVRTPGAEARWGITAPTLGAADVNKLVRITNSATPANIGAYADILKDNGGGNVTVAPFGTFAVSDTAPFVQITPAIGDTVEVVTPSTITVGTIEARIGSVTGTLATPTRNCVVLDSLNLDCSSTSFQGRFRSEGIAFFYARCTSNAPTFVGQTSSVGFHRYCGGGLSNPVVRGVGVLQFRQCGVTGAVSVISGFLSILTDTYFQNCTISAQQTAAVTSQGAAVFDRGSSNTAIVVAGGASWRQFGAVPDWGANNTGHGIVVNSCGNYLYVTKPTVNGTVGPGREAQVGGTDKQYGAVPYIEGTNNAALVLTA